MTKERLGYWIPLLVALAVLAIGAALIADDARILDPTSTTKVETAAVDAGAPTTKTTKEVVKEGKNVAKTTTTTEQSPGAANQPAKTETTTKTGERTVLERSLGDGGMVALQAGVVLLAAFLAAAIVQRMIVGQYAIKIGSLELSSLAPADTTAEGLAALDAKLTHSAANVQDDLAVLYRRLELLQQQIDG